MTGIIYCSSSEVLVWLLDLRIFRCRFTQIQKKSKSVVDDELVRKHRMLSFNMERRPEVAASLLLNQVCFNF